jgi:nuclear pore complex protein Nup133
LLQTCLANAGERLQDLSVSEDEVARFKAAFLHAAQGNLTKAKSMIEELFPGGLLPASDVDALLDTWVAQVSQEMVDDFPASDPRWAQSIPRGKCYILGCFACFVTYVTDSASSTTSLILLHQLDDKLKAHALFLKFLHSSELWTKVGGCQLMQMLYCTSIILRIAGSCNCSGIRHGYQTFAAGAC